MTPRLLAVGAALLLACLLPGCAAFRATPEWSRVVSTRYPGAGARGACEPFARAVQADLQARGFRARTIPFFWARGSAGPGQLGTSGGHIICVWVDAAGETWGVDNLSAPRWLTEPGEPADDARLARAWAGPSFRFLLPKGGRP